MTPGGLRAAPRQFQHYGRRLTSVVDQVVWSAANALTMVAAARLLPTDGFGQLSSIVLVILTADAVCRALVAEPFLLRHAQPTTFDVPGGRGRAPILGAAAMAGPFSSLLLVVLVVFMPGISLATLGLGALACIATVLQSAVRLIAHGEGRPWLALISDSIWLVIAVGFVVYSTMVDSSSINLAVIMWTVGAAAGALVGALLLACTPDVRAGWAWLRATHPLGRALAGDTLIRVGSANLSLLLVGALAGSEILAALRGAYLLLGPMNAVTEGIYIASVPALASHTSGGSSIMARTTLLTGVLVASWIGFGAVVLLLPSDLMGRILGDTWNVAEPVLPILLAASVVGALAVGAFFGARAWRGAGQLLRVRVLISPIQLLALPIAAASAGANAYAYGVIFLAVVQLLLYWRVFTRLDRAAAPSGVATSIT